MSTAQRPHRHRRPRPGGRSALLSALVVILVASACNGLAFGRNVDGRLGIGVTGDRSTPTAIDSSARFVTVSAGDTHSCGITGAGALHCWGSNLRRQLGVDTPANSQLTPVAVGGDDWIAVSAGSTHTCGIRAPGFLYCWGGNDFRQARAIGGNTVAEPTQVTVANDWTAVSAGQDHTCGIRPSPQGGVLLCWGSNAEGRLGNGTSTGTGSPFDPIGPLTGWTDVDAGIHTCGVRAGGQLFCWGRNANGQLGTGDGAGRLVPTRVGTAAGWVDVEVGDRHTCGRRTDAGLLSCWGRNANGQLGDGFFVDRLHPVPVAGVAEGWTDLSVGGTHTCGLRAERAWCWGSNAFGAVGDGTTSDRPIPVPVSAEPGVVAVSAGRNHTLILR